MVKQAAKSADMRKAASVTALRVGHLTEVTQFVILIEASNNRQLQALSDAIEVCRCWLHNTMLVSLFALIGLCI
jgi:ribosomal silencing factor RsfS